MLHQPVRGDPRHHVIGMVDPFPPLVAQREVGNFVRGSGAEAGCVTHARTIEDGQEHGKNILPPRATIWEKIWETEADL